MKLRIPLRRIPALLCLPLLFVVEYEDAWAGSARGGPVWWVLYDLRLGPGVRVADMLILGLAVVQFLLRMAGSRRSNFTPPAQLAFPLFLVVSAWALSLTYGIMTGGEQLFYDWRNAALGLVIAWIVATSIENKQDVMFLLNALLASAAVFSLYTLSVFLAGGGTYTKATGRIPYWDSSVLSVLGFAGMLALSLWLGKGRVGRVHPLAYALPCVTLVVLSSRRNQWGELAIGLCLILLLQGNLRRKSQAALMTLAVIGVAAMILGPSRLGPRFESLNPFATGTPESNTNPGHIDDLLDAWDVVQTSPILGIGQGKPYRTNRIRLWKKESWMVHNAVLHVWVRYGLLGLIAYLCWHGAFFRYLVRLRRRWETIPSEHARAMAAFVGAALAWSFSVFLLGLFFEAWPYTNIQLAALIGVIWGITFHRRSWLGSF
jgi:O-antigen ligase